MFSIMLRQRLKDLDHTQHELAGLLTLAGAPTSRQAISHWLNHFIANVKGRKQ